MTAEPTLNSDNQNLPQYQTKIVPEKAVAATEPFPERHDVDRLADAIGVEMDDSQPLEMKEKLEERDRERWQLDPDSAEDH